MWANATYMYVPDLVYTIPLAFVVNYGTLRDVLDALENEANIIVYVLI